MGTASANWAMQACLSNWRYATACSKLCKYLNQPGLTMDSNRRKALLSLLALPAGCTIQPLGPVRSEPLAGPASTPPIRPPALGQSWTYQKFNGYNSALVATEREEITALEPRIILRRKTDAGLLLAEEHHQQWGQVLREPTWDFVQNYVEAVPLWPQSLAIGATSSIHTHYRLDDFSFRFWINVQTVVKAWEKIYLPQGEFNALHIQRFIGLQHQDITRISTTRWDHLWLVPEIGRWAVREISGDYRTSGRRGGGREDNFRWELTSWT